MANNRHFALLIDADNAQASLFPAIFKEINKQGTAIIRLIYGDFTNSRIAAWEKHLQEYAIKPIQVFPYTIGKNATDNALIIDAMDILHTSPDVDSFCIVSSDSDYTRLANRIRENNLYVLGIGRKSSTATAFVNACNRFIFTGKPEPKKAKPVAKQKGKVPQKKLNKKLAKLLKNAFELVVEKDGWANFNRLESSVRKINTAFDPKIYGHSTLLKLLQQYPNVINLRKSGVNNSIYYVRVKK